MIYLDNAATSFPKPKGMIEAMTEHMLSWCGNPGRSGHSMSRKTAEAVNTARISLADFLHAPEHSRILFTSNATGALNLAIHGTLKKGDHVITTAMEHNSVLRPIIASGADYTIVKCAADGSLDPAEIEAAIRPGTRMIACTHVSNVTGTVMPLSSLVRICQRHNRLRVINCGNGQMKEILLMVDASQSLGHIPVSVDGIDLLAAPGHKGLMGPMGTGFLYVRPGLDLRALTQGGTGTYSKVLEPPLEFPESFEAGTINAPGIVGLGYSLKWLSRNGIAQDHQHELTKALDDLLRSMKNVQIYGPASCTQRAGIVTFNINGWHSQDVASLLDSEFGIATRAGFHCAGLAHKTIGTWETGAVRMSIGVFNNMRQIKLAADAVYKISKMRPGKLSPSVSTGCNVSGCRRV